MVRASQALIEALLLGNLDKEAQAAVLDHSGTTWVVASWPFRLQHGPRSSPVVGMVCAQRLCRYACRVPRCPRYVLHAAEEGLLRPPVELDGLGHRTSQPYGLWRLVETADGLRTRLVVVLPATDDDEEDTARIVCGDRVLEEIYTWGGASSSPLEVPPSGELRIERGPARPAHRLAYRFEGPMLFRESSRPGNWLGLAPGEPLPPHEPKLYLVGRADTRWVPVGLAIDRVEHGLAGGDWSGLAAWTVKRRDHGFRPLYLGTQARTYWAWEPRPALSLATRGGESGLGGGLFYDDSSHVEILVQGFVGGWAGSDTAHGPALRIQAGDTSTRIPIPLDASLCRWSLRLSDALASLPRSVTGWPERFTITLVTPTGIARLDPYDLTFYARPRIEVVDRPRAQPGQGRASIRFAVPAGCPAIEFTGRGIDGWQPVTVAEGQALIDVPVTPEACDAGRIELSLRIGGIPFRAALRCALEVVGLVAEGPAGRQLLRDPGATLTRSLSDGTTLRAIGLAQGDRLVVAEPKGGAVVELTAATPGLDPAALHLTRRRHAFDVSFQAAGRPEVQPIGRFLLSCDPRIDAVDVLVGPDDVRVRVRGFVPVDGEVTVALVNPSGDDACEAGLIPTSEPGLHEALLERSDELSGCVVEVREADGHPLRRAAVADVEGLAADRATPLGAYRAAVAAACRGEVPIAPGEAGSVHRALVDWAARPDDIEAHWAYSETLRQPPEAPGWLPTTRRELARLIEAQQAKGDFDGLRSAEHADRFGRLLDWAAEAPSAGRALGRAAAAVALAACCLPDSPFRARGLELLFGPGLLVVHRPEEVARALPAAEVSQALEAQAKGSPAESWWVGLGGLLRGQPNLLSPVGQPPGVTPPRLTPPIQLRVRKGRPAPDTPQPAPVPPPPCEPPSLARAMLQVLAAAAQGQAPATWLPLLRAVRVVTEAIPAHTTSFRSALTRLDTSELGPVVQGLAASPPRVAPELIGRALAEALTGGTAATCGELADFARALPEDDLHTMLRAALASLASHGRALVVTEVAPLIRLICLPPADVEVGRWLALAHSDTANGQPPAWIGPLFDALEKVSHVSADPSTLTACVPDLVAHLGGQHARRSLARLLARSIPPIPAPGVTLPAGFEGLAGSIVELLIGERLGARNPFGPIDFFECSPRRARTAEAIQESKAFLPALCLLAAALQMHHDPSGRHDADLFNVAGDTLKLRARYHYGLGVERGDVPAHRLECVITYLEYLRRNRWERYEPDIWTKIHDCVDRSSDVDAIKMRLECARYRADQGLWHAGLWWLEHACPEGPTSFAVRDADPSHRARELVEHLARFTDVAPTAAGVGRQIIHLIEEEQRNVPDEVRSIRRQRCLDALWCHHKRPEDVRDQLSSLFDNAQLDEMNEAIGHALWDTEPEEQLAALLTQPGVPPFFVQQASDTVAALKADPVRLLVDGARGEPRRQLIAWIVDGGPNLVDELAVALADRLASDLRAELATEVLSGSI